MAMNGLRQREYYHVTVLISQTAVTSPVKYLTGKVPHRQSTSPVKYLTGKVPHHKSSPENGNCRLTYYVLKTADNSKVW